MKRLKIWWKKFTNEKLDQLIFENKTIITKGGEVEFSKATAADIQAILAVERDVYAEKIPWTYSNFLMEISVNPEAIFLLARCGEKIIGYIGMRRQGNDLHISNLAVISAWQRLGVGQALIKQSQAIAKKVGLSQISLEVRFSNKSAQAFYRKLGFHSEKILKKYYIEEDEDGIEMIYQVD